MSVQKTCPIFLGIRHTNSNQTMPSGAPYNAQKVVKEHLEASGINIDVYPAITIFPKKGGCPNGGKACASFRLPRSKETLDLAKELKDNFKQRSVIVSMQYIGTPTIGFTIHIDCGYDFMLSIAKKWQQIGEVFSRDGKIFPSCGITYYENDNYPYAIISGEYNPDFYHDLEGWKKSICQIAAQCGISGPDFFYVSFNYIK